MTSFAKSTILLPLYIYPDEGAWKPLYDAVSAIEDLQSIVIVNPNSGPGSEPWWPNADYVREVAKLNALPNVRVVGYVATTYCQRPIEDVLKDIEKYAERSSDLATVGCGVEGIFFDETTNVYSEEVKTYLDAISEGVKASDGILGDKLVIHNPGTAVDARLAQPGPDVTVTVETSFKVFQTKDYQRWLGSSPYDRESSCYMVHSAPLERVEDLVQELRPRAGFLFVTSRKKDFYQNFRPSWRKFVAAMAQ
ncbi:Spherulation-specific family 4 [Lophiotrema nucula]|uniref:Spherulation-specific family 4 n=1 Tax=Lophiotrema nucula TaxID=690887 RepID=A0A6A5YM82_9PLEO|nr:Spherulation-specific family 4 [Lophiotrema nucula]